MHSEYNRRHMDHWPWRWLPLVGYGFLAVIIAATLGLMQRNNDQQQDKNKQARAAIVFSARETVFLLCESENNLRESIQSIIRRAADAAREANDQTNERRLEREIEIIKPLDCASRAQRIRTDSSDK